ncbi:MAG: M23 family metallopeptidase [Myxococcota bacterium]
MSRRAPGRSLLRAALITAALAPTSCQLATLIDGGDRGPSAATGSAASCGPGALPRIAWPLAGRVSHDFAVIAYLDGDPGPGLRDFMGHTGPDAVTYDGHDGIDIDIGGFRRMDDGVPVYAGLDGEVIRAEDGAPDRNTAATAPEIKAHANDIVIRAASGVTVAYWHLRRGSVRVKVGERVRAGQQLAEVGSSGISSGPHLHISAYGCDGGALDMMALGMFSDAPPYDPPRGLLSFAVLGADGVAIEPPPRGSVAGVPTAFDFVFSAVRQDEELSLTATDPAGGVLRLSISSGGAGRMQPAMFWRPSVTFGAPGDWTLVLRVGDDVVDQRLWPVSPAP